MKKHCLIILSAVITALIYTSCGKTAVDTSYPESAGLRMTVRMPPPVKSSISTDSDHVDDLFIHIFGAEDGRPVKCIKADVSDEIRLILEEGSYHIYAVANAGEQREIQREEEMRKMAISTRPGDLSKGIPMCWEGAVEVSHGRCTEVEIGLERLTATVGFTLDMGLPEGLEITSMRLCQGATDVRPFMKEGSRALTTEDIADGDYATDSDLSALMSGESICFHVPENCQGRLLPDNTDPWAKVPDNIPEKAGLCSYIEMKGRWTENSYYSGEITYRFFLGEDPLTSFDIRRNTVLSLVLCPDEENFDRISWKIDTSQMGLVGWGADSDLSRNFHDKEHFHVTERIRADIVLDRYGIRYWKARENRFILAGIGPDGATKIRFDDPICDGEGVFHAIGTCIEDGEFELVLCDRETGEMPYHLDSGRIIPPILTIGRRSGQESDKIIADQTEKDVFINGDEIQMDLFLTDQDGYNLNSKDWYGCDLSVCRWNVRAMCKDGNEGGYIDIGFRQGEERNGGPAIIYTMSVSNDGKDEVRNAVLSAALGPEAFVLEFDELLSGAKGRQSPALSCKDIHVTIAPVPDDAAGVIGNGFMYAVRNPSCLPVSIRGIRIISIDEIPADGELKPVIGGDFTDIGSEKPLAVSLLPQTLCSISLEGSSHIEKEDEVWFYSGNGFSNGHSYGSEAFLVLEAGLAYPHGQSPEMTGSIIDIPSITGLYLYNGDNCQKFISSGMAKDAELAYGSLLDRESVAMFHELTDVDIRMNSDNELTARSSDPIDLDVKISGELRGHIRCITLKDPFLTPWGHYFKDTFPLQSDGRYGVGADEVTIGGSCIPRALALMREEMYYSALDLADISEFRNPPHPEVASTIREYLKPYGITMTLDIDVPHGRLASVSVEGVMKYDYRTSSPVSWPKGMFSNITIIPSSYSGYDSKVDDDGCPPGKTFEAGIVTLDPGLDKNVPYDIYLIQQP